MLLMPSVQEKLMLMLGFLIVDNWMAKLSPDETGVVKCTRK